MTKQQAIEWYREIQAGNFDASERWGYREKFEVGEVAKYVWNDPAFAYGIEYGVLIAIVKIFDLAPDEA